MKVLMKCEEVKPVFNLAQFEASLKPGDVFYRKTNNTSTVFSVNGCMVFMRLKQEHEKYVNLLSNNLFNNLSVGEEYFLAPNATMVLNIETK